MLNKKDRPLRDNLRYLIKGAWDQDETIFWYFIGFTILSSIIPFIGIFTPKLLIGELMGEQRVQVFIYLLLGIFLISAISNYGSEFFRSSVITKMTEVRFNYMNMTHIKSMSMDFKYTEDKDILNVFKVADRAVNYSNDGIEGTYHTLFRLLGSMISFLGYVTIVYTLHPLVLVYLLVNVSVIYFLNLKVKKYEHSKRIDKAEVDRKIGYVYKTMSDFAYGKDIRVYNVSKCLSRKYKEFLKEHIKIFSSVKCKNFSVLAIDAFLLLIREGIIYIYLIYKVIYGDMQIDNFTMYFITIGGFATLMEAVIKDIAEIRAQNMYFNDFRDYLEMGEEEEEGEYRDIQKDTSYEIEFKNVSFKYPNSDKYIYKNLSLKIRAGQRLAIVGVNGAGKTTFIKLLTRLYEPTDGEILLNGINIKEFNKQEYYELFSAVFQEIKVFAFSVSENIAMKKIEEIDRERVIESLDRADIGEKISSLEKGIDTSLLKVIDKDGVELSGGQNQKLALARALYKNGDIVVLDEPTAALDVIAEYNTYVKFNDLIGDKTAIYVSHRLASTRFCDVIAFFENGEIKEYGTHEELIEKNGRYKDMFDIQAQYYKEEVIKEGV